MDTDFVRRLADIAELSERTAVWRVEHDGTVSQIRSWSLRRTRFGVHICGYNLTRREGRVSSALVSLDPANGEAVTSGGNTYALMGEPGRDGDAEYVWQRWCKLNDVRAWEDVSAQLPSLALALMGHAEEPGRPE